MSNRGRLARRLVVGTTLLWCAVAAAAGGGAEAATASGEIVVLITDHREAIDDFSSLVVTVGGARLHQRARLPDEGWVMLETTPQQIDLTRYRDGATFELLRAEAPAARYDAADLVAEAMARGVVLVGDAGDSVGVPLDLSPARVDIAVRPDQVTQVTSARPSRQDLGRVARRGARRDHRPRHGAGSPARRRAAQFDRAALTALR